MTTSDWARHFFNLGYNPLPSRSDRKSPMLSGFARYRDGERIPRQWIEKDPISGLDRWWGPNLQLCLGVSWKLMVVDLDGAASQVQWKTWTMRNKCQPTWTARTGGGGIHMYFKIPHECESLTSRILWKVESCSHSLIEILGDKRLVIAPPSIHVDSGLPYLWVPGRSPMEIERPPECPEWVRELTTIPEPALSPTLQHLPDKRVVLASVMGMNYSGYGTVLDRLSSDRKITLARGWGLRFARSSPNSSGWISCHAIGREDIHPSASYHPESGVYWEHGRNSISFAALAVELGAFASVREVLAHLESFP